ncbi:MAG: hypothetical protein KF861_14880, partial [Planctomycetaceae bacterium]|nr:hypothetical protein [Planctomycetaceae bacterium]
FAEGFRAGYKAVCMGNDNVCAPPMPPRRYWSSCYLNCEGKAKAMAWYDGFGHGIVAASSSGCGSQCQVVTGAAGGSGELGSALKGYQPPLPNQYGNQPIPEGAYPERSAPQPIPSSRPLLPPPAEDGAEEMFPEDGGTLVPQPPAAMQYRNQPQLPAAEAYRVPVF